MPTILVAGKTWKEKGVSPSDKLHLTGLEYD
jgi:hypothetical protein